MKVSVLSLAFILGLVTTPVLAGQKIYKLDQLQRLGRAAQAMKVTSDSTSTSDCAGCPTKNIYREIYTAVARGIEPVSSPSTDAKSGQIEYQVTGESFEAVLSIRDFSEMNDKPTAPVLTLSKGPWNQSQGDLGSVTLSDQTPATAKAYLDQVIANEPNTGCTLLVQVTEDDKGVLPPTISHIGGGACQEMTTVELLPNLFGDK